MRITLKGGWTRRLGIFAMVLAMAAAGGARAEEPVRFDVFEYVVEGNTVLPAGDIETAVYPFLGPQRSLQEINAARAALERAYHDRGYLSVAVELPEQQVSEGTVMLRVTEGRVERLKVTNSEYHLPSRIREAVPSLAEGSVPQFSEVQEQMGALAGSADRQVTPLLRPGRAPGTLEVELAVEDQLPLHGSVELNNKQSYNTDEGRLEAGIRYDNLFQRGHSVGLNWFAAPTNLDHANVLSGNYGVPLAGGDYAYAFVTISESDTPAAIGGSTVVKGSSYGFRYRFALPARHTDFSHGLAVGMDYKDNEDALQQGGAVSLPRSLKYATLAARYDHTRFPTPDGLTTSFSADLVLGIRGLTRRTVDCDGTDLDQFACKRFNAKPNFAVLRLGAEHRRPLWSGWRLDFKAEGQAASGPLVSQEQFGVGGSASVRGYYEFEQFGDHGARLSLELGSPTWFELASMPVTGLVFYDRGDVWVSDALPGERDHTGLAGAGVGLRADGAALAASVEWALPLLGTNRTDKRDGRWHVSLSYKF